ncbi:MAG: hypothetical protein IIC03_15055, partial [Proteobacteria bacterium]|nr:hypothetical protein [Pseudomonadota bacterium]
VVAPPVAPARALRAAFRLRLVWSRAPGGGETAVSLLALAALAALVLTGLYGTRDPLANPLALTIWTIWWVGFTLAQAVFGDLWRWLNPWTGLHRLIAPAPPFRLPARLGYWPAVAGLLAFGWFELVDIAPADPTRLARAVAAYWALSFAGTILFGAEAWLARAECFSVFFRFIARLAPLRGAGGETRVGPPGAHLIAHQPLPVSGALFLLLALSTVSFDGLSKTFFWLGRIGVNPLAFPGRSAVVWENTAGLIGAWAALAAAFALCVLAGLALAGERGRLREAFGRLALAITPIALGYHLAHYLPVLLVNGQYALAAGAALLGLGEVPVTTSFFNTAATVRLIWLTQAGAIVVGHIVAVALAHRLALELLPDPRRAALSQLPVSALMVLYTLFGLWLLASPTGA